MFILLYITNISIFITFTSSYILYPKLKSDTARRPHVILFKNYNFHNNEPQNLYFYYFVKPTEKKIN